MYWTYGIVDPRTGLFVYVGQTNDFVRRQRQHLSTHRVQKTRHAKGSIKTWLKEAHAAGVEPGFIILDIAETEEASLLSESAWVDKLGRQAGHPIRNLWEEHREILAEGRNAGSYEGKIFKNSKVVKRVGGAQTECQKIRLLLADSRRRFRVRAPTDRFPAQEGFVTTHRMMD